MSSKDQIFRLRQRIMQATGTTRFALVPLTREDLAALSERTGYALVELEQMHELERGLVMYDDDTRFERGDEILRDIFAGSGKPALRSKRDDDDDHHAGCEDHPVGQSQAGRMISKYRNGEHD